jgi:hypothetical protein
MEHLKLGYNDVMSMPTAERRYHLGKLLKSYHKQKEQQESQSSSNGKNRKTTISGDQLKHRLKSGQIPNN